MTSVKGVALARGGAGRALLRVVLYYGVVAAAALVLDRLHPVFREVVSHDRLQQLAGGLSLSGAPPAEALSAPPGPFLTLAALSMVGSLVVMLPVSWVYMITKQRRGYDEAVVQALIILPVTVTGIVIIVQNSLALAFSLAGIVAAVRFRITLADTKDAVYIFLAIGAGLAAGVQALGLAALLTVIFNGTVVAIWTTNFGNIYADQRRRIAPMSMGDALAGPESAGSAIAVGDPRLLEAMAPAELREVAERMARTERYIEARKTKDKKKRPNGLLIVHTDNEVMATATVEPVLEELATWWRLAEIVPMEGGRSLLEYLVRARADVSAATLVEAVRDRAEPVSAAEYRSLKGLKKRPSDG